MTEYKSYTVSSVIEDKLNNKAKVTKDELDMYHEYIKKNLNYFFDHIKQMNDHYIDEEYNRTTNYRSTWRRYSKEQYEQELIYIRNNISLLVNDINNVWSIVSNRNQD